MRTRLFILLLALGLAFPAQALPSAISNPVPLPLAMGGTAAVSASLARDNLGLTIGTNVQAYDADLAQLLTGTAATPQFARLALGVAPDGTVPFWSLLGGTAPTYAAGSVAGTFQNSALAGDLVRVSFVSGTTGQSILEMGDSGDTDIGAIIYDNNTNGFTLRANNATAATLSSTGAFAATAGISGTTGTFTAGAYIGAATSSNLIDDASNGGGSTTLYIGNQSITVSSDRRIKTDIRPSTLEASDIIKRLAVVDFRFADGATQSKSYNGRKRIPGLIAQDVEKVLPVFVNTNGHPADGPIPPGEEWKIDYQGMVPVLVKALQEEVAKRESLEVRLAVLEGGAKPPSGIGAVQVPGILRVPAPTAKPTATPKPKKPPAKRKAG